MTSSVVTLGAVFVVLGLCGGVLRATSAANIAQLRTEGRDVGLASGVYNMGGTDQPFVSNTGNNFASFLLGSVSSATFTRATASWLPRWWSHAFYGQTDWKPMRRTRSWTAPCGTPAIV